MNDTTTTAKSEYEIIRDLAEEFGIERVTLIGTALKLYASARSDVHQYLLQVQQTAERELGNLEAGYMPNSSGVFQTTPVRCDMAASQMRFASEMCRAAAYELFSKDQVRIDAFFEDVSKMSFR